MQSPQQACRPLSAPLSARLSVKFPGSNDKKTDRQAVLFQTLVLGLKFIDSQPDPLSWFIIILASFWLTEWRGAARAFPESYEGRSQSLERIS